MKEFDLIGLGNSLVDILLELTDAEFDPLGFEKGTMRLTERDDQQKLLTAFGDHEPRLVSGGSVANSVIACSQLGGKGAFIGSNSALVAPVKIGDGAYVGSGSVITHDVPAGSLAIGRARQVIQEGAAERLRNIAVAT